MSRAFIRKVWELRWIWVVLLSGIGEKIQLENYLMETSEDVVYLTACITAIPTGKPWGILNEIGGIEVEADQRKDEIVNP